MIEELMNLPVWIFSVFLFVLILFCLWLWAIIDCISSKTLLSEQKLFWILVILLVPVFGIVFYLVFVKFSSKLFFNHHKKPHESKKLVRSIKHKIIAGVCGGIGDYFGISPSLVRLVFLTFGVSGLILGFAFSEVAHFFDVTFVIEKLILAGFFVFSMSFAIIAYLLFWLLLPKDAKSSLK